MHFRNVCAAAIAAALTVGARELRAQGGSIDARCVPGITQDACQKAVDVFNLVAPQLGTALAGGNAVLGTGGPLGGFPHFTVGLRANAFQGTAPNAESVTLDLTRAQSSDLGRQEQWIGFPAAEAAVGIFKGIPVGFTNVGGIDAIVSAFYVPSVEDEQFTLDGGKVKFGFGGRLGILQETTVIPGVSVTYLRRDLPTLDAAVVVGSGDSVSVTGLETRTTAWRLVAAKSFFVVGLAAGVGQDRYESEGTAGGFIAPRGALPGLGVTPVKVSQEMTRTNYFADLMLNLPIVKIVGEVGRAQGGSLPATYNSFGGARPDDPYTYGSVGLRVAF